MDLSFRSRETGQVVPAQTNKAGNLLASIVGGKYADAALDGRLFYAANINMVATSTTLNTTFVGLGICNPSGSGKIAIIHEFGYGHVVAAAAAGILALATTDDAGFVQDATECPVQCTRYGHKTPVCIADEGATITLPVIVKVITQFGTSATGTMQPTLQVVDLGGSIVLAPGRAVITDTTTIHGASSAQFSFLWEEIDA